MRVALLVLLAFTGFTAQARAEVRVAVLYFDNNTGDRDFELLRKGMADMLITDLSQGGIQVVEREKFESLIAEMKLQRSKYFDRKTALKLGRGMGATHAVTGAFSGVGSKVRIDVRMIDVENGKIQATDKVIGKKSDFFDLQQKLVTSFACSLDRTACKQEPSEVSASLPALLSYSRGLDQADAGNLEDASKSMRTAMSKAPRFSMAKKRFMEIMKRVYAAKRVRSSELSSAEKKLRAKCESVLSGKALFPRRVGYRILRGQLILKRIDALFDDLAARSAEPTKADLETFSKLVGDYRDNQKKLLAAVDEKSALPAPEVDDGDRNLGEQIGLGDEAGNLDFYSSVMIRRDLGAFLTTGKVPKWGSFRWSKSLAKFKEVEVDSGVRIRGAIEFRKVPRAPVDRIHPKYLEEGLAFFDAAVKDAAKLKDPEARQEQTIRSLVAHGHALFELGRPEEAIARWQTVLDRYPKAEDFAEVEGKIRRALEGRTP